MITVPNSKTTAAALLYRAKEWLEKELVFPTDDTAVSMTRGYNDHKAAQLLEAKADLLLAEAKIEAWEVDLGFNGICTGA